MLLISPGVALALQVAWSEKDAEAAWEGETALKAASAKRLLAEGAGDRGGAVAAAAAAAGAPVRAAAVALAGEGEARGQGQQLGEQMEPMICFETALKALYFSNLMYYHEEVSVHVMPALLWGWRTLCRPVGPAVFWPPGKPPLCLKLVPCLPAIQLLQHLSGVLLHPSSKPEMYEVTCGSPLLSAGH